MDRYDLNQAIAVAEEAAQDGTFIITYLASELASVIDDDNELTEEIAEALESALPVLTMLGDEESLETAKAIEAAVKSVNTKQIYPE